jgi:hypothetical protein
MGIGASLVMIAVGAVMVFGLEVAGPSWMDLDVIGWILMAVGALGVLLSLLFWSRRRSVVVHDEPTVIEERRRY